MNIKSLKIHIKNLRIGTTLSSSSFSIQGLAQPPESGFFFCGSGSPQVLFCFQRVLLNSGILAWSLRPPSTESLRSLLASLELFVISGIIPQLSRAYPSIFPLSKGRNDTLESREVELEVRNCCLIFLPIPGSRKGLRAWKIPSPTPAPLWSWICFSSGSQRIILFPKNPQKFSLTSSSPLADPGHVDFYGICPELQENSPGADREWKVHFPGKTWHSFRRNRSRWWNQSEVQGFSLRKGFTFPQPGFGRQERRLGKKEEIKKEFLFMLWARKKKFRNWIFDFPSLWENFIREHKGIGFRLKGKIPTFLCP